MSQLLVYQSRKNQPIHHYRSQRRCETPNAREQVYVSEPTHVPLVIISNLAGPEGFEPPNARTKTWCLTAWRRPITHHIVA